MEEDASVPGSQTPPGEGWGVAPGRREAVRRSKSCFSSGMSVNILLNRLRAIL